MLLSLKNKTNKIKKPIDISNFKNQRNYPVNLNKPASLNISTLLTANCLE